ncbi:MAG TPA: DNA-3-methyladenine glycosylase [Acidimicrobiales bacterium]|nr:DNA-3-methyladenine glycosylase [Acidimicrobiales bacterium]
MAEGGAGRRRARVLPRSFYARDAREVAPELLNKVLVLGPLRARLVEVEAYVGGELDPGSHAYRGRNRRNATMFGPPGHLYVYFTYGMHWCANAVCDPDGTASAVLLRAAAPLAGLEQMRANRRRPARTPSALRAAPPGPAGDGLALGPGPGGRALADTDLLSGPAKLCQAFGLTGDHDGADLVAGAAGAVHIVDDGTPPPDQPVVTTRVGLKAGSELPWRWVVAGNRYLSRGVRLPSKGEASGPRPLETGSPPAVFDFGWTGVLR